MGPLALSLHLMMLDAHQLPRSGPGTGSGPFRAVWGADFTGHWVCPKRVLCCLTLPSPAPHLRHPPHTMAIPWTWNMTKGGGRPPAIWASWPWAFSSIAKCQDSRLWKAPQLKGLPRTRLLVCSLYLPCFLSWRRREDEGLIFT